MEEFVSLKVVYQGQSVNVPDGTVAVIGADANATSGCSARDLAPSRHR